MGKKQAEAARDKFKDIKFDVVYTSDFDRAIHTAEILHKEPVHPNNRLVELRERSYGSVDGKLDVHLKVGNEIKKQLPIEERWHFKHVPDMESDHELAVRYVTALTKLAEAHPGETIMVVSHGTAIKTFLKKVGDLHYDAFPSGSFKNTEHAIVDYSNKQFTIVEMPNPNP